MFSEFSERVPDPRYRGMNPSFVKKVWKERRERKAREEAEQRRQKSQSPQPELIRRPTAEEVRARFRVIEGSEGMPRPAGLDIIKQVCEAHNVPVAYVLGKSRNRAIVDARQAAMAAVYQLRPDMSCPQIGKLFNRDHTTVLYAIVKLGVHVSQTGGQRVYPHYASYAA